MRFAARKFWDRENRDVILFTPLNRHRVAQWFGFHRDPHFRSLRVDQACRMCNSGRKPGGLLQECWSAHPTIRRTCCILRIVSWPSPSQPAPGHRVHCTCFFAVPQEDRNHDGQGEAVVETYRATPSVSFFPSMAQMPASTHTFSQRVHVRRKHQCTRSDA